MWIFDIINVPISELKALYPHLTIFDEALIKVKQWAHGEIKMPVAKQAILECHAVSKTIDNKHDIALIHAVGQGLSTVHVETHALGLVFYELTALVYANEDYEDVILKKINFYIERLNYIKNNETKLSWAPFIIKDKPNKERLLILKETT